MGDRLDRFRNLGKPATAKEAAPAKDTVSTAEGPGEYVAFAGKDRMESIEFRPALRAWAFSEYAYLMDVTFDGPYGSQVVLTFTFVMVIIKGRNLQGLVTGLRRKTIDFVQEFHPDEWERPKDPQAPLVESIEFVTQDFSTSIAQSRQIGSGTKH